MASRGLGSLTLDLIAKIGGFTGPLTQAERAANKSMSNIEKRANAFGRSIGTALRSAAGQFLAFAGVTVTVGATLNALKGAIDLADETRDMSIRFGVGTEALSEFRYAAQQTGTDIEALGKGLKVFAKNATLALNPKSKQASIFKALLGDTYLEDLKDIETAIPKIADKFKQLPDGIGKNSLAQAIFGGKSGTELIEFLNQGADGLQKFADKAKALGIVIDQDTADAADKFNDDLADLKGSVTGLALGVAKELLPALDDLVINVRTFVSDGDNAKDIAHGIADGFRDMHDAGVAIGQVISVLQGLRTVLNGLQDQAGAVGDGIKAALSGSISGIQEAMRRYREASAEVDAGFRGEAYDRTRGSNFQNVVGGSTSVSGNPFANVIGSSDTVDPATAARVRKLQLAIANPTGGHTPKHSGKSDAQREAEQLAKAINQMTDAQRDWETELAGTGNQIADDYAKRLADITEKAEDFQRNGVPTDKIEAFKKSMSDLALKIKDKELKEFQENFKNETLDLAAALGGPAEQANRQYEASLRELEKQMKSGILTAKEFNDRSNTLNELRHADAILLLRDLQEEANLLGMTNDQQEVYNNLKATGTTATDAYGQSIIKATEELQKQRKATEDQIEKMDGLRDSAKTLFDSLKEGKGIWDSLKDAAGNFADILYDIASRKLIEQIFGQAGTTGSGSSGAGWLDAIFGLFSGGGGSQGWGGAATGGLIRGPGTGTSDSIPARLSDGEYVIKASSVKKYGPGLLEALNMGRLPAFASGGMVGSMGGQPLAAGLGLTQIINYQTNERVDNRSRKQVAQAAGMAASSAIRSNRG